MNDNDAFACWQIASGTIFLSSYYNVSFLRVTYVCNFIPRGTHMLLKLLRSEQQICVSGCVHHCNR